MKNKTTEIKKGEAPKKDDGKARFDLIPPYPLFELAKVFNMGCDNKYPKRSWEAGMEWGRIIAALERHVQLFKAGRERDPEDGLHDLAHAMWCCAVLMEYEVNHPELDDRSKNPTLIALLEKGDWKLTWTMSEDFKG